GVIIEEMNMYKDNPMHHVANLFEEMLWQGSGLSHDIIGTRETVGGVNREDFVSFLSRWYGHSNMLVVLAGDERVVMADSARERVERAFAKPSEHERQEGKQPGNGLQKAGFISEQQLLVVERPTEQAHIVLGWKGLRRGDDQRHALSMLSVVLGGSMSSRLFTEVREKRGLCYYVSSDTEQYRETGFFGASAGVETKRVHEAIEVITAEFMDLASGKRPVTSVELDRAKEHVGGRMLLSFEDSRSVAQFYGMRQLLQDKIEDPDEVMRQIRAVSIADIQSLAAELMKEDQLRLGVIGPFKEAEFARFV
ncbi:insulinase family protein, partial [Candidatus Woesebacteria bacterium]|nr:insulinase family protein [Candidatus Woesebacteria bacterium]